MKADASSDTKRPSNVAAKVWVARAFPETNLSWTAGTTAQSQEGRCHYSGNHRRRWERCGEGKQGGGGETRLGRGKRPVSGMGKGLWMARSRPAMRGSSAGDREHPQSSGTDDQ